MANNRLYIVDTETKEYICIAKSFGDGWEAGNIDLYADFLNEVREYGDSTRLIIGTENDDEFYKNHTRITAIY